MENLVVGDGSLDIHEVTMEIEKSTSYVELLIRWKFFGRKLRVDEVKLLSLDRRINNGTCQMEDILWEILSSWKAEKGRNATLKALHDALVECRLISIADALKTKFSAQEDPQENDVDIMVQGRILSLYRVLGEDTLHQTRQRIASEIEDTYHCQPINVIRDDLLPREKSNYRVPTTFIYRHLLDEKVFTASSTKNHLFLVKGIDKTEFAKLVRNKPMDLSGKQLEEITVQHILLESDSHYEKIAGKTNKPVHVIQYGKMGFFWKRSSKSLDSIRNFIKPKGNSYGEEAMVTRLLSTSAPCIVSIDDSSETNILADLATRIKESCRNAIVFLIKLHKFVQHIFHIDSLSAAREMITSYACADKTVKSIVDELIKNEVFQFYLLLDGYDEALKNHLDLLDTFLEHITYVPNVRIVVSTNSQLKSRLESVLNQLSFEVPSHSENYLIEFLTNYWTTKHGLKSRNILEQLARQCLEDLEETWTNTEKQLISKSLRSMIMAEAYAEEAAKAYISGRAVVQKKSLYEMYESAIDRKFEKAFQDSGAKHNISLKQKYMNLHIDSSLALIFPEWQQKFQPFLAVPEKVDESILQSIGLMEKSSKTASKFLHETHAEYLLSKFIARNLHNPICMEFFFKQLLGKSGTNKRKWINGPDVYELKYPLTTYFLNTYLLNHACEMDFKTLVGRIEPIRFNCEDVCIAASTCCRHNLEKCFELITEVLHQTKINSREDLGDKYFKHLPHVAVAWSMNASIVQKVLKFTTQEFGVDLSYHVFVTEDVKTPGTPFHFALMNWSYDVVSFLLKEYEEEVLQMKMLLHHCVGRSGANSDTVIQEKLLTIDMLVELNPDWLKESVNGMLPVLAENIHVELLKRLIDKGADINGHTIERGTILHMAPVNGVPSNYRNVVYWALENGFKLINHRNKYGRTPLIEAIMIQKIIDDDILRLFLTAGADLNFEDDEGNSVLFYAIRFSNSLDFIRKILDNGGDIFHLNTRKANCAHIVLNYINNPELALSLLKFLESRGFTGYYQKASTNVTPLEFAQTERSGDLEIIKFLKEATLNHGYILGNDNDEYGRTPLMKAIQDLKIISDKYLEMYYTAGADFTAKDHDGNSILFYAARYSEDPKFLRKIINHCGNVHQVNKRKQTAVHFILEHVSDPELALNLIRVLESKGFTRFATKDLEKRTPFLQALTIRNGDLELINYLKAKKSRCSMQ